jgi:uncharacterized protein (DUF1501 family)
MSDSKLPVPERSVSRRRFLVGAGTITATGVAAACSGRRSGAPGSTTASSSAPTAASTAAAPTSTAATTVAAPTSISTSTTAAASAVTPGRVLVVVQLGGGNDALNTLVPLDGRYHDARPTIGHADDTLVRMIGTDRYGLHPSFANMKGLLDAGHVAAVASIGYATPNRSHFVAMADWWSADPASAASTGWLGRYLDSSGGTDANPMRAVALGSGVPAMQGRTSSPTVVINPAAFDLSTKLKAKERAAFMEAWQHVVGQPAVSAAKAIDVFKQVKVSAESAGYNDAAEGGDITDGLTTAAELALSGTGVQIVHLSVGGFDTHAGELATHEALLDDLATGVQKFFDRLTAAGAADNVLLMTMSEFGRRVQENGSGGTDHGKGGVQFLIGPSVNGGVIGDFDLAKLDDGDLRGAIDPRSMYASALAWLGADPTQVLGGTYADLGVVRARVTAGV